jgi:hypothetical protein
MIQQLGNDLIPVLAIVCGFSFVVIWIIAATIDSIHKTNTNAKLKQRLIDRGDSAAEIDRIMNAGESNWSETSRPVPPLKPAKRNKSYV